MRREEAPPASPGEPSHPGGRIGGHDAEEPARAQQLVAATKGRDGVREVLQHVSQDDCAVAALLAVEFLDRDFVHEEPELVAGVRGGRDGQLHALDLVASGARLVQQQARAAAHVEQSARRRVLVDQIEHPARGPPAAGLLREIGLVVHLPVQRRQLGAGGERRLLNGPAGGARVQVAVLAGPVVGRGQRLGVGRPGRPGIPEDEPPRADRARGRGRHAAGHVSG